jgi:hypothetical protein
MNCHSEFGHSSAAYPSPTRDDTEFVKASTVMLPDIAEELAIVQQTLLDHLRKERNHCSLHLHMHRYCTVNQFESTLSERDLYSPTIHRVLQSFYKAGSFQTINSICHRAGSQQERTEKLRGRQLIGLSRPAERDQHIKPPALQLKFGARRFHAVVYQPLGPGDAADDAHCYLFCLDTVSSSSTAYARFFNPTVGVVEDSATGSAAGPLACQLIARGIAKNAETITIEQGYEMGRPSLLNVEVRNGVVRLAGRCILSIKGRLLSNDRRFSSDTGRISTITQSRMIAMGPTSLIPFLEE